MNQGKERLSQVTKKQSSEFGLVSILVALFIALYYKSTSFVAGAFLLTIITIITPNIFYPLAVIWFWLGKKLSVVSTRILMGVVFYFIVMPVGLLRKLFGIDNLKLKQFKKSTNSVMVDRNHLYVTDDLTHTY